MSESPQNRKGKTAPLDLPHSEDAEKSVLGALLLYNPNLDHCATLRTDQFYWPIHGRIFDLIALARREGRPADATTLAPLLAEEEAFQDEGMSPRHYLTGLTSYAIGLREPHIKEYAALIQETSARRDMMLICRQIEALAASPPEGEGAAHLMARAEGAFRSVQIGSPGKIINLHDAISRVESDLSKPMRRGMKTGMHKLNELTGGLHGPDLIVLAGRPSMGKAQPLDAKVLRSNGAWVAMGNLQVGDHIASVDGAPSEVTGVFPQGELQVYRITFSDGRSTECCADHLWSVTYRDWSDRRTISTAKLMQMLGKKRYQNRLWVDHPSPRFGRADEVLVDPWFLGAWLGNGCTHPHAIVVSSADEDTVRRIGLVAARLDLTISRRGKYDYCVVSKKVEHHARYNPLLEAMRSLGVCDLHSHEKFVPDAYKTMPARHRLALLQGLMDTDGWVEKQGAVRFGSASERLTDDVIYLARSLGFWARKTVKPTPKFTYKGEKKIGRPSFLATISGRHCSSVFRLDRKRGACPPRDKDKRPVIASIAPSRRAEAQCITVSHPKHLYVTDDFIVTHNTSLAVNIATNVAMDDLADEFGVMIRPRIVAFFSLEMNAEQIAGRILSRRSTQFSATAFPYSALRSEKRPMAEIVSKIKGRLPAHFLIDERGTQTVSSVEASCRDIIRTHGHLDFVAIDYLQLMTDPASRKDGRVNEITSITMGLKAMAKRFNVPVLALSQLSRQVESRQDKTPQLSDLRESGSIEQDADMVLFAYREHYYLSRIQPAPVEGEGEYQRAHRIDEWQAKCAAVEHSFKVISAKNRAGPIGVADLYCDLATDLISDEPPAGQPKPRSSYWMSE